MNSTADQVVSLLVNSPFDQMSLHDLKRVSANLDGSHVALITAGYTPEDLQPLLRMMVASREEIENRYCGGK